jgi:DNA polymerase
MAEINQMGLFDFHGSPTPSACPDRFANLDELVSHARNCQRCPLASGRTQVVIERGNRQAPIMIIGEAPGQNEDETGLPFVGRAGQLLDKILASVELTDRDVYICNVVKCRPPQNRDPAPQEISACNFYLREQMRLVNPLIVLLTGKYAMTTILNIKEGITKVRGQWYTQDDRWYMPIFHPAYLLRNASREKGSPKWLMWQDIQAVKAKLVALRGND